MFITVFAIICLNVGVPGTCLTEPAVNSNREQLTMGGCLGLLGFESAKEFWEHHPLYHTWKFKGWACQLGNRAPPDRQGLVTNQVSGRSKSRGHEKTKANCNSRRR
jgi:hypothetical protein